MHTIADHATADPICVQPASTLKYCLRLMLSHGIRHLPVVDGRRELVGIVYDFQLLRHCRMRGATPVPLPDRADRTAISLAVAAGRTARRDQPVGVVFGLLSESWEDAIVVLDAERRPVGLFTVEDALALALDWLTPWWTASQAMTDTGPMLAADQPVRRALADLWQAHRGHGLVVDGPKVVGMQSLRELLSVDPDLDARVGDLVRPGPLKAVAPNDTLVTATRAMRDRRLTAVPIVDGGRPVGLLTATSVLRAVQRTLEVAHTVAS